MAPTKVLELELTRPLPSLPHTGPYRAALVLVRLHDEPLGVIDVELGGAETATLADGIRVDLGVRISAHLERDGAGGGVRFRADGSVVAPERCSAATDRQQLPPTSVVVATRDRAAQLANCLASLLAMDHPRYEIIVVDSAPSSAAAHDLVARHADSPVAVRYSREEIPGLARARNHGVRVATGDVVAFTDDDVRVDRHWLSDLTSAFSVAPDVACTTGLSLPAELETRPQVWFEQFGGFSKGFDRQVFDRDSHRGVEPLYPYRVGWFGSGLNMAFDAAVLRRLGGFDEHLGAGTRVHGGEDLDAFLRIVLAGHTLVYEPRALVWHYHRRDLPALRRQLQGSGVGLSAVLVKLLLDRSTRADVLARAVPGVRYLLAPSSAKNAAKAPGYPRSLTLAELGGVASGPFVYTYSRWRD